MEYHLDSEEYRKKFRLQQKYEKESYHSYIQRLKEYARRWLQLSSDQLIDEVVRNVLEAIVVEQFINQLSPQVQIRLRELKPKNSGEAAEAAEDFVRARESLSVQYQNILRNVSSSTYDQIKPKLHSENKPQSQHQTLTSCRFCGGVFPHPGGRDTCPARGKQCSKGDFRQ